MRNSRAKGANYFFKAENKGIREREEGQSWRESLRIQFTLVFASMAGPPVRSARRHRPRRNRLRQPLIGLLGHHEIVSVGQTAGSAEPVGTSRTNLTLLM